MKYILRRYSDSSSVFFDTRAAFCEFVRSLPVTARKIAKDYFLVICCSDGSAVSYVFKPFGRGLSHLRAIRGCSSGVRVRG